MEEVIALKKEEREIEADNIQDEWKTPNGSQEGSDKGEENGETEDVE